MLRKLVYIPLSFLLKLYGLLPIGLVHAFGRGLSWLLYRVFSYRLEVVRENLKRCFPDSDAAWRKDVEKKYYRHLGRIMAEVLKTPALSRTYLRENISISGWEHIEEARKNNIPVILMCGHSGNWEWAALRFGVETESVSVIYKPLKNKYFDNWYYKLRSRFGVTPLSMSRAGRLLVEKDRFGLHCFVADQTPSDVNSGYWLDFMGQDTLFFDGFVRIASKMKARVVFASMVAVENGYKIGIQKISDDASLSTPEILVKKYAEMLEQHISAYPWNWLWSHRRWKRTRPKNM